VFRTAAQKDLLLLLLLAYNIMLRLFQHKRACCDVRMLDNIMIMPRHTTDTNNGASAGFPAIFGYKAVDVS
jgi:hypothetical protein